MQGLCSNVISGRGLRMGAVGDCNRVGEGDRMLTSEGEAAGRDSARIEGWMKKNHRALLCA